RPAAINQLETLGKQLNMPVFSMGTETSPVEIAEKAIEQAKEEHNDYVIIDTAGRLHVDNELMDELTQIKQKVNPDETFLVVDSMTGQDAVNVAESFNDQLDISGVVLTKLDGDTRGGAALSIKAVTDKPIKFAGMGEKLDQFEPFHPDRMASRILGMGDVLTLIEKAQTDIDEKQAKALEEKMRTMSFTFDDFLEQMDQVRNMGPLDELMAMIPGANKMKGLKNAQIDESHIGQIEAIIRSMTKNERQDPNIMNASRKKRNAKNYGTTLQKINNIKNKKNDENHIDQIKAIIKSMTKNERQDPNIMNASRKKRIAKGSGTTVSQVNRLLKQFNEMKKMMKQMTNMQKGKKGKGFKLPFM